MADRYIGVTIGPIFDTVNLASSPAALWTGSYMFSYLSKTICKLLTTRGIAEEEILSPFYTTGSDFPTDCDGVGLYHDRIVFRAGDFSLEDFKAVKAEAILQLGQAFGISKEFLSEYIMISAAEFKDIDHPICDTTVYLDGLELAKPIVKVHPGNELLAALVGETNYGNETIKALPLVQGFKNWQLWRNPRKESLKSLSEIANTLPKSGMKKHKYYAVVRSDGDYMNRVLRQQSGGSIRDFSKACLFYCADIAKQVRDFGGVAIYSGGDDLLAILPCENADGKTVLHFLQQANVCFSKWFSRYDPKPSLSIGVTICYHKFPLYEALEDSQHMLFDIAKEARNCTAIHLQKHAGQSEGLVIPNSALAEFLKFYDDHICALDSEWIHSVHYKLTNFRGLFIRAARNHLCADHLFDNIFDADVHTGNRFVREALPEFYNKLQSTLHIKAVGNEDQKAQENEDIDALCYMLRIFKFFVEKGGEEK